MKRRAAIALSLAAALGAVTALLFVALVRASDHLDGPRAVADPQADITDVFAFTSPENPRRVVLAMTVVPFATPSAVFSAQIDYVFRVRRVTAPQPLTLDASPLDVTCSVATLDGGAQRVTCLGPAGMHATAIVGDTAGAQGPMRVFAGRRADPSFFDRQGALATIASGRAAFTGQNTFAGADVLAIVVEIDAATFTDGGTLPTFADGGVLPTLAVAAETTRRGH